MADKYIALINGKQKQVEVTTSSAGAASSGKAVGLDSNGNINPNMMPPGMGPESVEVTAAEALSQWDLVNIFDDSGTLKARLADAGANKYAANAYCPAAIDSGNTGNVYTDGLITGTGMTPGADQYLSEVPGEYTETAVSGSGKIHQKVGWAMSPTKLAFHPEAEIELV